MSDVCATETGTDEMKEQRESEANRRLRLEISGVQLGFLAALSILFTLFAISSSRLYGQLALGVGYDDVSYFADALRRLNVFYSSGVAAFLHDLVSHPPHSPYSTLMAFGSFLVFGIEDAAPYYSNALIIFGLLLAVDGLLAHGLALWQRAMVLLLVLSLPFVTLTANQCRPDLPVGVATAAAVALILGPRLELRGLRQETLAGVLFGLAMLSKPSVFPVTLAFLVGSVSLAVMADRVILGERIWSARTLLAAARTMAPAIVLFLPYAVLGGRGILRYLSSHVFGEFQGAWRFPGGFWDHALAYSVGVYGRTAFGGSFWLLVILLASAIAAALVQRRRLERGVVLLVLASCGAYATATTILTKSVFLAAPFYFLLIFSVVFAVRSALVAAGPAWTRRALSTVLIVLTFGAVWNFKLTRGLTEWGDTRLREMKGTIVRDLAGLDLKPGSRLLFVSGGAVGVRHIEYQLYKQGRFDLRVEGAVMTSALEVLERRFEGVDVVFTANERSRFAARNLPSSDVLDEAVELLKDRPGFALVRKYSTNPGGFFYVFRKKSGFWGWSTGSGRSEQWRTQKKEEVMRAYAPFVGFRFETDGLAPVHVGFSAESLSRARRMRVELDGRPLPEVLLAPGRSTDLEIPLQAGPGRHEIRFYFDPMEPGDSRAASEPVAVFRSLYVFEAIEGSSDAGLGEQAVRRLERKAS